MKEKISIKDISEMAGVSIATVSRVINKNGRYSKETEEKVRRIIKEHNYVPNMIAKGLRTNRMTNIGIIIPNITNEFFVKLAYEIEQNLFLHGYGSFICNTNEDVEMEKKRLEMLKVQNVSGLIYISGGSSDIVDTVHDIPTVFIDRAPIAQEEGQYIIVESDNVQGGYLATKELLERGCKNIIMLTDKRHLSSQTNHNHIKGYKKAHKEAGVAFNEKYIVEVEKMDFQTALNRVTRLIDDKVTFDGIFASSDWLALGSYTALTKKDITVPDQVKIVGYGDISASEFNLLPITTIHQQIDIIGKTTVDYLMRLLENKEVKKKSYRIPVNLVKRRST